MVADKSARVVGGIFGGIITFFSPTHSLTTPHKHTVVARPAWDIVNFTVIICHGENFPFFNGERQKLITIYVRWGANYFMRMAMFTSYLANWIATMFSL